ncbi:TetR/AcrR family transcriptional regulator [Streptomyces sp. NPDC089424]|uniref:TetR/AcrR family transcriptional regulator n=1 Tax=Streptomyces sp. NPDC089424 TaxID=3365917 RepID=UPI00380ED582
MSSPTSPPPIRRPRSTRATRARILDAALRELGRRPDSSLGDIAVAAGVARRTVYTHFAGRAALVEGLAEDAAEAIRRAIAEAGTPVGGPASALAHFVLTLWPVGDRYRTLTALAPQDLGPGRTSGLLAPARETAAGILAEGQRRASSTPSSRPARSAAPSRAICWHSSAPSPPAPGPTTARASPSPP